MKDPYYEAFKSINDSLIKLRDMIVELAKFALSINDYEKWVDKIND